MDLKKLGIALLALGPAVSFAQDAGSDPVAEYETLLRDIRGLEAYNALLQRQIQTQQQDLVDLQGAITQVPDLERQLPPLLINMVDGLDEFVELDLPFLQQERADRIANLKLLIENPDVSDSQKLRRVLEAWSIEVEYGSTFMTEQGQVSIDGAERAVDFVIMGRAGLLFQTADEDAITGAWDHENTQWIILGSEHRNPVRQAIRMARNQIAPDLLLLPVSPAQP
jgi:hypothetical protein